MSLRKKWRLLHEAHLKEMRDRDAREDYVRREGHSEGEDMLNRLHGSLVADNRLDDLARSIKDKEYREQLYKEYGIL